MKQYGLTTLSLPTGTEALFTRDFFAPRDVVFDVFTQPEHVRQWRSGPPGWSMSLCESFLDVGEAYRYVWEGPDGTMMSVRGVYQEVDAPTRVVTTERFDNAWYPGETRSVVDLAEQAKGTSMWYSVTFATQMARDLALESGFAEGMRDSFDRLATRLDAPVVTRFQEVPVATIPLAIPRDHIQQMMGPAFDELMASLEVQGIASTGPWYSHHFAMYPDTFDFEIGVPVATPITPVGRVRRGTRRPFRVVRMVHGGGYEGLGAAWERFGTWIAAQGLRPTEDLWEVYAVGPESSEDPAQWRTELYRPLIG